jgi:hypothetical protein
MAVMLLLRLLVVVAAAAFSQKADVAALVGETCSASSCGAPAVRGRAPPPASASTVPGGQGERRRVAAAPGHGGAEPAPRRVHVEAGQRRAGLRVETQYSSDGLAQAGQCRNRGESRPMDSKGQSLVLMNYFTTNPSQSWACGNNSSPLLVTKLKASANRWPNYIAVDFYMVWNGCYETKYVHCFLPLPYYSFTWLGRGARAPPVDRHGERRSPVWPRQHRILQGRLRRLLHLHQRPLLVGPGRRQAADCHQHLLHQSPTTMVLPLLHGTASTVTSSVYYLLD